MSIAPRKVNLAEKFGLFDEHWTPKVVGELNGQQVKLIKVSGEFVWHSHEHEDELFMVIRGALRMRFKDHEEVLQEGEFIVVPRGVEHLPVAEVEDTWVMLFEPSSTINTGEAAESSYTVKQLEEL